MSVDPNKVKSVFLKAVEVCEPGDWTEFLEQACEGDNDLRRRVEVLLNAHLGEDSLFDEEAGPSPTLGQPISEKPGTQIGPYKLLQQTGEGGMGVVYVAEQKEPVKRRVALKIIKPGMDTRQVIARFGVERQALAMMDHPNIAKVLDAGQTESGRPYFVMELVKGVPITQYCDEQHLNPKERLQLFVPICQAVQHAHQKGIIHRDLKPGNILVALFDGQPVPKVIDFGVAKATSQALTEKTIFTQLGQVVGTLEYMSPEQAQVNQLDVDTRSDIYSLGVLLYELLTGETPFDRERLRSAAFDEMLRIIREEEPSKPSTRVSSSQLLPSIAANRHVEPARLGNMIRGELDWIVMKALEKDRARRYETASKFAEDVQHYLNDEAVVACPPSRAYRFRKFARRNKVVIGTTAVVAASLIAGIIGTSWQAYRATKAEGIAEERLDIVESQKNEILGEKNRAVAAEKLAEARLLDVSEEKKRTEEQAEIAQAINDFLNTDLLRMADAAQQVENNVIPDPNVKLRTLLDRAAETIKERFHGQPLVEAAIRDTLGGAYLAIGQGQKAEEQHQQALELRKEVLGTEHPNTLTSMDSLAVSFCAQGRYQDAENMYRETIAIQQRVLGAEHFDTLQTMGHLANSLCQQGRRQEGEKLYREVLEIQLRVLGPEHFSTLVTMGNLANSLLGRRQYREAEKLQREVLENQQRVLGAEHPSTLLTKNNLAVVLREQKRYTEAGLLQREALETQQRVLTPKHPQTLLSMNNLADLLCAQHHYAEAEKLYLETCDLRKSLLGPGHPDSLVTMYKLSSCLLLQKKHEDAEELSREIIAITPKDAEAHNRLGVVLDRAGQHDAAAASFRKAIEIDSQRVIAYFNLGVVP